jgi:HAD superfamily phosphoserine phosphatase-like hydrolase
MKRDLYLTDLDGTLTRKSLVLGHAGFLIERGIIEDTGIYSAWCEDMKNEKLIVALAQDYQRQLKDKRIEDLMVHEFIEDFLGDENNWYNTLEMLITARNFGEEVCLITGSSDFLVKELAERLNFKWFATKYHTENGILTGEITGMFADYQKDEVIRNNFDLSEYSVVIGLGDTASDYGIFKHCHFNYLVDPTKETLEKLILKGCRIDRIVKE